MNPNFTYSLPKPAPVLADNCRDLIGFDIGGTKCAVSRVHEGSILEICRIPTGEFAATFDALTEAARPFVTPTTTFGISCGGPLDARRGIIVSPPNLRSSWHGVEICAQLEATLGGRAILMNDANACALAEWQFGAGRGCQHMIFLTSGTGMGAGVILNGRLYEGATGDAGEVGHLRLAEDGPVGFGKAGSFEGFCSGGGIARLADLMARTHPEPLPAWYPPGGHVTTRQIADAAKSGDAFAIEIMRTSGKRLGEALAVIVDLYNPERIVIGGFFPHCRELLEPTMNESLAREALPHSRAACQILPAELGETIGSHGAIAIALQARRGN
ncbi:MAG TPA: ROK family protein [Opitutus sp.]|nr:ROK family protein [Opitutus sp.]